jgi:xylulokinase
MSKEMSDSNTSIPTPANLYLGLDLSTQQLKAILLSEDGLQVHQAAVHFDNDLPAYGTVNGTIQGDAAGEVFSPVCMWLEAIDVLLYKIKKAGVDFSSIVAVGGAAQVRRSQAVPTISWS